MPDARALLDLARRSRDDLEVRLLLAAAVQSVAKGIGIRAVVTGGTAVDFYAAGAAGTSATYPRAWKASVDVDVIALTVDDVPGDAARLREAVAAALGGRLQPLGEDSEGRPVHTRAVEFTDPPYAVEIMSAPFLGDSGRIWTLEIAGEEVHLRGPEDTLLAYAESGRVFRDGREWERALAVHAAMKDDLDEDYLDAAAERRDLAEVLAAVRAGRALRT